MLANAGLGDVDVGVWEKKKTSQRMDSTVLVLLVCTERVRKVGRVR